MAAIALLEPETGSADPVVGWLDDVLAQLGAGVADGSEVSDADRIDRIARLEQLRAVVAAAQAAECVKFAQSQVQVQLAHDVHPTVIGRGIADQIALACHLSPHTGSRRLGVARALWFDLPQTYAALTAGELSEHVAELVVTETRHLDAATRQTVDAQIVAAGITGMGVRAAAACARKLAYQADPQAYVQRGRTERKHRRVGLRPAPDTMAILTGYLPVEQGVACLAALRKHTDGVVATGDERSRDQIMADTLVERLTGQTAPDIDVEVHITMPLNALTDPDSPHTAHIIGGGPLPGPLARDIIATSHGRRWWRRLFTAPPANPANPDSHPDRHPDGDGPIVDGGGPIVGGDPTRRRFDGWLTQLITLRDQTCRDPYCDAAIRHIDHITRHTDGGPTTLTNGRGVCARGNYAREMPGWRIDLKHDGLNNHPHTITIHTPTGHTYTSRAPDPP